MLVSTALNAGAQSSPLAAVTAVNGIRYADSFPGDTPTQKISNAVNDCIAVMPGCATVIIPATTPPNHGVNGTAGDWQGMSLPAGVTLIDYRQGKVIFGQSSNGVATIASSLGVNGFKQNQYYASTTYKDGGFFTPTSQAEWSPFWSVTYGLTPGQQFSFVADPTYALSIGNAANFNATLWCFNGNDTNQANCANFGEVDVADGDPTNYGNLFVGTIKSTKSTQAYKGRRPRAGSVSIAYTAVANNRFAGVRPIYNENHRYFTTAGTIKAVGTCSSVAVTPSRCVTAVGYAQPITDTFTFSSGSAPFFDPNSSTPCSATAAGVHCNPISEYVKLGNTNDYYSPPCTANDAQMYDTLHPTGSLKCISNWFRVVGVPDATGGTQIQIAQQYPTAYLPDPSSGAQPYLLIQGIVPTAVDQTKQVFTLPANNYSWVPGDTLISPPDEWHDLHGLYVVMEPQYGPMQTANRSTSFIHGSNAGTADLGYMIELTGNSNGAWANSAIYINPSKATPAAIDVSPNASYSYAALKMGGNAVGFLSNHLWADFGNSLGIIGGAPNGRLGCATVTCTNARLNLYSTFQDTTHYNQLALTTGPSSTSIQLNRAGNTTNQQLIIDNESGGQIQFTAGGTSGLWAIGTDANLLHGLNGHFNSGTSAPDDVRGYISLTAASSGTRTFNVAYNSTPTCVVSVRDTSTVSGQTWKYAASTTGLTVSVTGAVTATFDYVCMGAPN
jgi:hypothetical protein